MPDAWLHLTSRDRQAHHPAFVDHQARCVTDPEAFFPEPGSGSSPTAKALCRSCRHRPECLAWALDTRQEHGVWGGLTATQRLHILQQRAAAGHPA